MEWKIESIREVTDVARAGGFERYKKVRFTVDGLPHTIKISMSDFDKNKIQDIVRREAEKVIKAYGRK